jgi:hypothetical protein
MKTKWIELNKKKDPWWVRWSHYLFAFTLGAWAALIALQVVLG